MKWMSHFYIAIAYLNSTFCGAWTPSFCEFTRKMSKFQQNEHTPAQNLALTYFFEMKMNIYYVYLLMMII